MSRDLELAATDAPGPLRLQPVLAVESQAWGFREGRSRDTAGKVTLYEPRTCHGHIAQPAESHAVATLNGFGVGGHRRQYLSAAQPLNSVLLVIERNIYERLFVCGELRKRRHKPGAQAV